ISQTCNRAAVMQKLPYFVPAFSHYLEPLMRDGSQFAACSFIHESMAGSRSTAPLNRSSSVLIVAPHGSRLRLERAAAPAAKSAARESTSAPASAESGSCGTRARRRHKHLVHVAGHAVHGTGEENGIEPA